MPAQNVSQMIANTLRDELVRCRGKNSSFSLRALAKRVGIHSSALSEILNGKRVVSRKVSERIIERLGVDPVTRDRVAVAIKSSKSGKSNGLSGKDRLQLDADQHQAIADWFHFGILSLFETKNAKSSVAWISKRLNISVETAKQALTRLERLGLVRKNGLKMEVTGQSVSSPDEIKLPALKLVHQQNLDKAKEALFEVAVEQRDFSAITMAIDPSRMSDAKKLTRRYLADMEKLLEQGDRTEVYKLCVQLFPLTVLD